MTTIAAKASTGEIAADSMVSGDDSFYLVQKLSNDIFGFAMNWIADQGIKQKYFSAFYSADKYAPMNILQVNRNNQIIIRERVKILEFLVIFLKFSCSFRYIMLRWILSF